MILICSPYEWLIQTESLQEKLIIIQINTGIAEFEVRESEITTSSTSTCFWMCRAFAVIQLTDPQHDLWYHTLFPWHTPSWSHHHNTFLSCLRFLLMKDEEEKNLLKGRSLSPCCCQLPKQACRCDERYKYDGWVMLCRWPHNMHQRRSEHRFSADLQPTARHFTPTHTHTHRYPARKETRRNLLNPHTPLL